MATLSRIVALLAAAFVVPSVAFAPARSAELISSARRPGHLQLSYQERGTSRCRAALPHQQSNRGRSAASLRAVPIAASSAGALGWKFMPSFPPPGNFLQWLAQGIASNAASVAAAAGAIGAAFPLPVRRATMAMVGAVLSVVLAGWRWRRAQQDMRARQALDATSEWGRFANAPGARTRALLAGCARITPSVMRAKFSRGAEKRTEAWTAAGVKLADELIRLGPTYVKVGQIVSCREGLLPPEMMGGLTRLQDKVPAFDGTRAAALAAAALGRSLDELFLEFDTTPLAAASLGQVHRAVLRPSAASSSSSSSSCSSSSTSTKSGSSQQGGSTGGLEVAVKVQREGLRAIYDLDLALLGKLVGVMDRLQFRAGGASQKWGDLYTEATEVLYREIDYRDEASNAARFAKNFAELPWVTTPKVYSELCTEKLLVMEFLPGVKVTDVETLASKGYDRKQLASSLAKAYLYQFCKHGFFNTDPHPGNLAVDGGVPGGRLIFYDFGQACALSETQRDGILATIEAIVDLDAPACVTAFNQLGVLRPEADLNSITEMVRKNFASGRVRSKASKPKLALPGASPSSSTKTKTRSSSMKKNRSLPAASAAAPPAPAAALAGAAVAETTVAVSAMPGGEAEGKPVDMNAATAASRKSLPDFVLPAQLAFVARALAQMEGVGKALDPEFEFIAAAAPTLVEVKGASAYIEGWLAKQLRNFGITLPDFNFNFEPGKL